MTNKMKIGTCEVPVEEKELDQAILKFFPENPRTYSVISAYGEPTQDEIEDYMKSLDHVKKLAVGIERSGLMIPIMVIGGKNMVLDGNKQSYQIMVFSAKNAEIGDTVTKEVGRGATLLDAEGCYSHKGQKVLLMLVHKTDKPHVMQIIHRIDADAFLSVSKTQGVYGRNFEKLKF